MGGKPSVLCRNGAAFLETRSTPGARSDASPKFTSATDKKNQGRRARGRAEPSQEKGKKFLTVRGEDTIFATLMCDVLSGLVR